MRWICHNFLSNLFLFRISKGQMHLNKFKNSNHWSISLTKSSMLLFGWRTWCSKIWQTIESSYEFVFITSLQVMFESRLNQLNANYIWQLVINRNIVKISWKHSKIKKKEPVIFLFKTERRPPDVTIYWRLPLTH